MKPRVLLGALLALWALPLFAQEDRLAKRHALISTLYEQERHADLVREVDLQVKESVGTTWADSLHRYLYKYGYAHRKLKGAAAGTAAAEGILTKVQARGKAAHELEALFDLSWTYYEVGELKQCARVDSMAVAVADRDPAISRAMRGRARQYLAFDHGVLGDHRRTLQWALAAIEQYENGVDVPVTQWAESYTAAGSAHWHLGHIREAERYYRRALDKLGDGDSEAVLARKVSAYGNLGVLWQNAGDLTRAKNDYQQSLRYSDRIISTTQDRFIRDEAIVNRSRTYLNLATVYFQSGDDGRARILLDRAWKDRSGVLQPDDPQLIAVKERIADIELNAGNLDKAREMLGDYVVACERKFGRHSEEYVRASSKLGDVMARQHRHASADSLYTLSMTAGRVVLDEATDQNLVRTLQGRARLRMAQARWGDAIEDLGRARSLLVRLYDSSHYKVAQMDVLRAEAAFFQGDIPAAAGHAREALRILDDRIRALRSSTLPKAFHEPHLLPDALYWKVRCAHALAGAQPSAEQWQQWQADIDLAITALARNKAAVEDEASKLLLVAAQERLFDLAIDLAYASREQLGMQAACARFLAMSEAGRSTLLKARLGAFKGMRFAGLPDSLAAREQELIAALNANTTSPQRMMDEERAYADLLERLQRDHPVYFAMRYGEAAIGLMDVRRRLLSPGRALVAYAATSQALYALVMNDTGEQLVQLRIDDLPHRVSTLNAAIAERRTNDHLDQAHTLYQQVFAPLAPQLSGEELLIIPDGALHLLNFETLLTAPATATDFKRHLLVQRHAIAYLLSATTAVQFAQLARERASGALALAPGFTDEVKQRYLALVKDSAQVDHNFLGHVRQPFALRTAEDLGGVMRAHLLLGADATERGFRHDAGRFGILHLGTHAEMNATDPMYSRLVLSKDGAGVDPDADGYLHAYEIYELDLRAQLAVLTACRTGAGRSDGEGVRSLGYSFAYAGCPSLVMSLWNIDEQVSSAIITRFYELLADGLPKHMALRKAKLDHLANADEELALPYYWAGLVLVGDVEPVQIPRSHTAWWLAVIAMLCAGAIWWRFRRRS